MQDNHWSKLKDPIPKAVAAHTAVITTSGILFLFGGFCPVQGFFDKSFRAVVRSHRQEPESIWARKYAILFRDFYILPQGKKSLGRWTK